ncbi:FAD/NAD(P)-binding protein [Pseudocitrobacter cyperus]|uniref:FAD-dependent oxidoreductase n=1 Tax=Pseudocitrobacter cyperus TaxID=3112843 RepID=A0ABV0HEN2_9ENTR
MSEPHIVIIGGGFSGAAVAVHLLRDAQTSLRITVIEPREVPGLGVAYSAADPAHRINVPAARMQLSGEDEGAFERWYRQQESYRRDTDARRPDGSVYPQRGEFGRYVAEAFFTAAQKQLGRVMHLRDTAIAWQDNQVITAQGKRIFADRVVLAVSHPPPDLPKEVRAIAGHPRLIANPWVAGALENIPLDANVAIAGTALSMADVVASLSRLGHRGTLLAFSRHGLLSRANAAAGLPKWQADYSTGTLRQRLRQIREDIARAAVSGLPWQVVLDEVRSQGQSIWQQLSEREQRQFLRHLRRFWDVHRYRIAPQVADAIASREQAGLLTVLAARLKTVTAKENHLRLQLAVRGDALRDLNVDYLILTTGPAHATLTESQPFLRDLRAQGLIRPDVLGLGIDVDARSQTLNAQGEPSTTFLVSGPAARGRFGELMGLPQVADHAQAVARELLLTLSARCPAV